MYQPSLPARPCGRGVLAPRCARLVATFASRVAHDFRPVHVRVYTVLYCGVLNSPAHRKRGACVQPVTGPVGRRLTRQLGALLGSDLLHATAAGGDFALSAGTAGILGGFMGQCMDRVSSCSVDAAPPLCPSRDLPPTGLTLLFFHRRRRRSKSSSRTVQRCTACKIGKRQESRGRPPALPSRSSPELDEEFQDPVQGNALQPAWLGENIELKP